MNRFAALLVASTCLAAHYLHAAGNADKPVPGDATGTKPAFVHPGLLHNKEDFARMRNNLRREPWKSAWGRLIANRHAFLAYKPRPVAVLVRGRDRLHTEAENYSLLFNDVAAAYACALRWQISGDRAYAEKAVEILNAWSSNLKQITGSSDLALAAGIYGYQMANAAEIVRTYDGWKPDDFARFCQMIREVFYPINRDFLERHNDTKMDHYWANWDLCNIAAVLAIGILCDEREPYDFAVDYFKHGKGNGSIQNAIVFFAPGGSGPMAGKLARPRAHGHGHRLDGYDLRDGLEARRRSLPLRRQSFPDRVRVRGEVQSGRGGAI
jgi:hypothetical protein